MTSTPTSPPPLPVRDPLIRPALLTRPALRLGAGVATLTLLAGCGDGDEPTPAATSPSASPTSSSSTGSSSTDSSTTDSSTSPAPTSAATSAAGTPTATSPEGGGANTALLAAGRLVAERVPGSTVLAVESDDDGDDDWDVTVATAAGESQEADVSPDGTSILAGPRAADDDDDADDRRDDARLVRGASVDLAAAVARVERAVAGASISEINLDTWRGRVVWEADVASSGAAERTVRLDAGSGGVLAEGPADDDGDDGDDDD